MKRLKRSWSDHRQAVWSLDKPISTSKWSLNPVKLIGFFIVGLMVFTAASIILKDLPSHTRLRLLTDPDGT